MSGSAADTSRFTLVCIRCDRPMLARVEWCGREVQCPHCECVLRVPAQPPPGGLPLTAAPPSMSPKRVFNFPCGRCGCLLEAHTGMCGNAASCPTCAVRFSVPYLHPTTNAPYRVELLDDEAADPTPMHAYAASGHQAPVLHRRSDGEMEIECPRCRARCPVDANVCRACAAPFTLEAAPTITQVQDDARSSAALVAGILSLPLFFIVLPAIVAVLLGIISVFSGLHRGVPRAAIIGLVLGLVSLTGFLFTLLL